MGRHAVAHRLTQPAHVHPFAGGAGAGHRGRCQQVVDDAAERAGVAHQRIGVAGRGGQVTGMQPVSQQLGAGMQHGQRAAQFVRGVGDESALQRQGLRQGPDRPAGEQRHHRDRGHDARQFSQRESPQQPRPTGPVGGQIHQRHDPTLRPVDHQGAVAAVVVVEVGETTRPRQQRNADLPAVAGRHRAGRIAEGELHPRRRVSCVVGAGGHSGQFVGDLGVLGVDVDRGEDQTDQQQYGGQRRGGLHRHDAARAAHHAEVTGRGGRHPAPRRYPAPCTVRTTVLPSLRRR